MSALCSGVGLAARAGSPCFPACLARMTRYVAEEEEAKTLKRGMWAGTFTPPWDWRRENEATCDKPLGDGAPTPPSPQSSRQL